jgi:hypothetical protein
MVAIQKCNRFWLNVAEDTDRCCQPYKVKSAYFCLVENNCNGGSKILEGSLMFV